ncbi:MAG: response regulator [Acidobacteriota bacterium]
MKKRIFVIDDEFEILELTRMILEKEGFQVMGASSGREALLKLQEISPDLILLDINMPEMGGWELLRVLKADEITASIPVILFTIKSEVRDKIHGIQEGAFDYITKPFSYDELVSRVKRIFECLHYAGGGTASAEIG